MARPGCLFAGAWSSWHLQFVSFNLFVDLCTLGSHFFGHVVFFLAQKRLEVRSYRVVWCGIIHNMHASRTRQHPRNSHIALRISDLPGTFFYEVLYSLTTRTFYEIALVLLILL